jgi:hypothetical protein
LVLGVADLGQAEVSQLYVAVAVQQDVLGFDVAVDYVPGVQVLQRQQ